MMMRPKVILYLEKMRDEERMGQGIKSEERANDSEE
jgi:hypothetical protein